MPTDAYTKTVLTLIAGCLMWLCATNAGWPVQAQPRTPALASERAQPVVIVGWGTLDADGRVRLSMSERTGITDPNVPVKVVGYPMPPAPLDVRLDYSEVRPMPVGISTVKRVGEWDPIRTSAEGEPVRPRPGRE